ncbi:response regulator transcription factor [Paraburkholderia sp. JPY169]|uniref:Response regulator transcription factor n=2 Tax=Paraburkholderia youngii TaxID=2782701 RepID=A0A7Y6K894_9BURK|nr:response regulator transcription factor [Paraburkholderia youngii]
MKFAVLTHSASLFQLLNENFMDNAVRCQLFHDDISLSRAMYREDFCAIFIELRCLDGNSAVLDRRRCYADRRAPLIVVGTFNDRASIEMAYAAGADEVVIAPYTGPELAARTYQTLRRFGQGTTPLDDDCVTVGAYTLERRTASILVGNESVRLTSREFAIAWMLFSNAGEYVSRRQIAAAVWGSTEDIIGRTLEQHIYKLRKKFGLNGLLGVQLRTMYAHGYRIELNGAQAIATCTSAVPQDVEIASHGVPDQPRGAACCLAPELRRPAAAPARVSAGAPYKNAERRVRANACRAPCCRRCRPGGAAFRRHRQGAGFPVRWQRHCLHACQPLRR